jgi:D-serine dehydratase
MPAAGGASPIDPSRDAVRAAELTRDPRRKGFPLDDPASPGAVSSRGWRVADGDTATPVATVDAGAVEANAAAMAEFCRRHDVLLAPHAKTTLAPWLLARQAEHGAWGFTAALPRQVALLWDHGFGNVLLANEVTDVAAVSWLISTRDADPRRELRLYADSERGVGLLGAAAARADSRTDLDVLVELGHSQGRTGARGIDRAVRVARAVASTGGLRLVGVAGFEGTLGTRRTPAVLAAVDRFTAELRELTEALLSEGLIAAPSALVTAGGSLYFDRVVSGLGAWCTTHGLPLVLRSGCYLIHDHGLYEAGSPGPSTADGPSLSAALTVWARVISHPEPGLSLLDAGRRDLSFDAGMPVPLARHRAGAPPLALRGPCAEITMLSDQHAFLSHAADVDVIEGDLVQLGISHPCTTIDRWPVMLLVDDDTRVLGAVETEF